MPDKAALKKKILQAMQMSPQDAVKIDKSGRVSTLDQVKDLADEAFGKGKLRRDSTFEKAGGPAGQMKRLLAALRGMK